MDSSNGECKKKITNRKKDDAQVQSYKLNK